MFIKKDKRKIEEIFLDPNDSRESLKLSKRYNEFQGTIRILCTENKIPALKKLKSLNIYDNSIENLNVSNQQHCEPRETILCF